MKITLINPGQLHDAGEDQLAGRIDSLFFRARPFAQTYFGIPLALPTLAGATPAAHTVRIIDEMVERIDFDEPCDLVGLTAMTCKATRAYQIAAEFRKRGVRVVMGGIHASMCADEAAQHVDCVVVGEADALWERILEDAERGQLGRRYQADAFPDVSTLPAPRHDLTPHGHYYAYFLQTTRGCPRSCNFCTVTAMNGSVLRKKSAAQVVAEVQEVVNLPNPIRPVIVDRQAGNRMRRLASGVIFFADDNFAIDREHALDVCRALKTFQDESQVHLTWFTQADVKVGFDDELLGAMKDAGCINIFTGFESLSPEALKAMHKNVNSPQRYAECIDNIERHGIEVTASLIVGSDEETKNSGDAWAAFARENNLFYFFPNILTPYPGTRLMSDLEASGRILLKRPELYNIRNVVFRPQQMTPVELQELYVNLCERVLGFDSLLRSARAQLKRPKRFYLTHRWRFAIWAAFSVIFVILAAKRTIRLADLWKLLLAAPRMILGNGSLSAIGFVVNLIAYSSFSRGERRRLPPAAALPER